jgi:glycosyltransferase involved in cell wall biosynthesis
VRVALVTSDLPPDTGGGAEQYAADLATSLSLRDHDVVVLTASGHPLEGIRTVRLPALPRFDPTGSPIYKTAWHLGDQWRPAVYRAGRHALGGLRPDVVHSQRIQGLSASVFTAISSLALPHVHTVHDLNLLCVRASMTRGGAPCSGRCAPCLLQRAIRSREAARGLDLLLAPSDNARDRHVQAGVVPAHRALTIRQGARGSGRLRGTGEALTFGYIGALAPHKGVRTLLEAARRLGGSPTVLVAGSGPLAAEVELEAGSGRIEYVGRVEGSPKERFFQRLDVLVVPSEWEENAPLVVSEAAVRGVPCVVSDRGGLPETPQAWVVPAGRAGALADTLAAINSDDVRRRSRELLADPGAFSWDGHVDRVEDSLISVARRGTVSRFARVGRRGLQALSRSRRARA